MKKQSDFMKFNLDLLAKYTWLALIVVIIAVVFVVIIIPNTETRSSCEGFQYFVFLSQKMTENEYSLELLNGLRDIHVKSAILDGVDLSLTADVTAGDSFIIVSSKDPTNKKADEAFSYRLSIMYDIRDGIKDNKDTATCTGKIQ